MKRLAPNLRRSGLGYAQGWAPGTGERALVVTKDGALWDHHDRHDRHTGHESGDAASSQEANGSSHDRHAEPPEAADFVPAETGFNGCDDG